MRAAFDTWHDGLERTSWFNFGLHVPERSGVYEVCAWRGADVLRCRWDGDVWWAATRLADRVTVGFWRGITYEAYLVALARRNNNPSV